MKTRNKIVWPNLGFPQSFFSRHMLYGTNHRTHAGFAKNKWGYAPDSMEEMRYQSRILSRERAKDRFPL